jgi:uncharacterized protein YfaS (alpha-2-macroglobulin family)
MWKTIFGQLSWTPPQWLTGGGTATLQFWKTKPKTSAALLLALLAVSVGAVWSWQWYQRQPKPHRVHFTITAPAVTKLEKELKFPPLVVYFSEPAAPLQDLGKRSISGVTLEPQMAGSWRWSKDDILFFEPTGNWPAEKKFRVTFERNFFPRQVVMDKLQGEFVTAPFSLAIKSFEFYQDPTNPKLRQVVATLEATHRVDAAEIERHATLETIGHSAVFAANDPAPHFSVTPGLLNRLIYLRSSPITLTENEDWVRLTLSKGVRTSEGGALSQQNLERKTRVPSVTTAFRIASVQGTIVRNKTNEPEQIILIHTTAEIGARDLGQALQVWLLPKRPTEKNETPEEESDDETNEAETASNESQRWKSASDVPEELLAQAKPVQFETLPSAQERDRQHAVRIRVENEGELYVRVRKGVRAFGDYPLVSDHNAVIPVPEFPKEVRIEGNGGVLAFSGERKTSIQSRGLSALEYEIARVSAAQINHLVSQTEGKFEDPSFLGGDLFNEENISRIAVEHQPIAMENKWKANYSAFDFSEHLRKPADDRSERGLFFVTVRGWDSAKRKVVSDARDRRFVLVTDIGIVAKKNADGSNDIFVVSIKNGQPLADVTVEILGKNGIALESGTSDGQGHVAFASVDKSLREKMPVAFVARNGDDVAFMPYDREDRELNFSRFDIGGAENIAADALEAFVFTERGIYRPGDEIHIGAVIKARNWSSQLAGLPLEMEVIDARDLRVQTRRLTLPANGFTEVSYQTSNESPSGSYSINLYLVKNSRRSTLLGSTSVTVKEFLPDRMKIETRLSRAVPRGWIDPKAVRAAISLANLYGTPASDRRVAARMELAPSGFRFPEYRDFNFYDSLADEKKERHDQSIDLGEQKTDANGQTEFDLQLERFANVTFALRFIAEGFEGEGGRSVTGETDALISALPFVVGWKADGDLHYIDANTPRALELIALDPQLNRIAIENLTVTVLAQEYISVLTKQESGSYAYQSVLKERLVQSEKVAISASGTHYSLPTAEPGNFVVEWRDDHNRRVAKATFCVAGNGAVARALDKHAELEVKLDRPQCNAGDELAISITAPYAGAGLITIERDKVYSYRWFQTSTASSVQHIRVPDDFAGSGYVNVAFVRALDAKEVLISPLSYGVVPFTASAEKRRLKIDLTASEAARPGEPLHIGFKTDRPVKIVVFAVDQGILQVTDFTTPDPIGFFFRKASLGVRTTQIVDLIMPEFSLLRSVSAFGGGEDAPHLNPFKRVTAKPVVFWSGIIDAGPESRELVYDVPDFFSGTLTIMAVAVSDDAAGCAQRDALVRGPFVITPSVPVLAAPGDEFEVGVTVANNVAASGEKAEIELRAESSEHVSLVGSPTQKLQIAEGREKTTTFRFRANDKLGSGTITFIASRGNEQSRLRSTLSIRPTTPFMTEVRSGSFKDESRDVPVMRALYPVFAKREASVSALPLGLAHGLEAYLSNFPHGCSEQITSAAFCRLMLSEEADFGLSRAEVYAQLQKTFETLRRRQNDAGAFGYWAPENDEGISFITAYVMDFLEQAKSAGFVPSSEMFASGLRNLQTMVAREPSNLSDARTLAYAIYLLAREGVITTNYILNLRDYLEKYQAKTWRDDLTGVYLAGSLHLLHKDADAEALIAQYRIGEHDARLCDDFYQPLGADSQYLAILAREFPARLKKISAAEFENILRPIGEGNFNTLSAAYAVAALKAYAQNVTQRLPELSMTEIANNGSEQVLARSAKMLQRANFSMNASAIRFGASDRIVGPGVFFQVIEAGFDRESARDPVSAGLEIYRELLDKGGQPVTRTHLGEAVHVRLRVRSLQAKAVTNIAIVDLLPGGFEIPSLRPGAGTVPGVDYVEVREDRAVFFASAGAKALEINYDVKSCNRGEFIVPPPFAESMYDRKVKARGVSGKIFVEQ